VGGGEGKLKTAVAWLLERAPGASADDDPDAIEALAEFGVPREQLPQERHDEPDDAEALCLWAWHVDAARLFVAMRTQWVMLGGMFYVQHTGLNYQSLPVVEQRLGITTDRATFEALQVMERAAMPLLDRMANPQD